MSFLLFLLLTTAVFVLVEVLRPKPRIEDAKPLGLGDFQFPTATEGRVVPLIFGTVRVKGPNVVWYGDLRQDAIKKKVKTGLFSSQNVTVGFRYNVGIQFAMCRGPGVVLKRIAIGDNEVFSGTVTHNTTLTFDLPSFFNGDELGNGGVSATMRFFAGEELTQPVSTYLSNFQTEGTKTPAYRGTCYLAPDADPLYVGNSANIKPWDFDLQRIPNGLGLGDPTVNTDDANPMNVIYEIMVNTDYGLKIPAADIDTTNFTAASSTLSAEGNGFSMILDREMEAREMLRLVEEQIDGVTFQDPITGKWKINLARFDYDINTVREITAGKGIAVESFSRGSWKETTNIVRSSFVDRADDYKQTYGLAQDMANQLIQGGVNISTTINYPGCKNRALGNQLAWRDLRGLSYPLAKLSVVVDRTFYDVQPGSVLAFTDPDLGFTKLPVRVQDIDLGEILENRIALELVQDIFSFQVGRFSDPGDTGWTPPSDTLVAFTEQIAFEAPRGFVSRDPDFLGIGERIWAGAVREGNEVSFKIVERHSTETPSGSFVEDGEVFGFMFLGTLTSNLDAGTATPTPTVNITPAAGLTQSRIEGAFVDNPSLVDQGENLLNLILINNEFMLVQSAANGTGNTVDLSNVRRAALDSVHEDHVATDKVYMVFVGGGLGESTIPTPNNVHVKLLPRSATDELAEAAATQIAFTMADRYRRPYPPAKLELDGTHFAMATSMEANGSDGEDFAIDLSIIRRDFRTGGVGTVVGDEVEALTVDAATIFTDYPSANSSDHDVEVRNDPAGANTLLFTDTFNTAQHDVRRFDILKATDGVLPTTLRFTITARHTENGDVLLARYDLVWDFSVTTALTGDFNFGALDDGDISNVYTADAAGTHSFTLTSATATNDIEYRLNGGSWTTLIAQGGTTGDILGVSVSDTIEVRHVNGEAAGLEKQLDMNAPGAGTDAYAILFT